MKSHLGFVILLLHFCLTTTVVSNMSEIIPELKYTSPFRSYLWHVPASDIPLHLYFKHNRKFPKNWFGKTIVSVTVTFKSCFLNPISTFHCFLSYDWFVVFTIATQSNPGSLGWLAGGRIPLHHQVTQRFIITMDSENDTERSLIARI